MPYLATPRLHDWELVDCFSPLLEGSKVALLQDVLEAFLNNGSAIEYIGIVFVLDL